MPAFDPFAAPILLAIGALAVLIAGVAKGGFGAGAAFASTPLLALVAPPSLALATMLPLLILMDASGLWAYRGRWRLTVLKPMLIGAVVGILFGAALFPLVDPAVLKLMIGLVALGFVAWRLLPKPVDSGAARLASTGSALFWSAVSGFTSMTAHAGGPPVAMHLLRSGLDKTTYQATTVAFFAAVNLLKLAPFVTLGLFDATSLGLSLTLAPLAPLGIWLGVLAHRHLPERRYFQAVIVLLVCTAAKLIWDGLSALL